MTDDELQARLRRLEARPDADWDAMAAAVRDGFARATSAQATRLKRRRWAASAGGVVALAAALLLWLHGHHRPRPAAAEPPETFHVFEDLEPGEMLEELSPAEIDRMAKAFNKGV
ncbi:MAG TPA: hypothetical protein VF334_16905 [Polyangia bacterium]